MRGNATGPKPGETARLVRCAHSSGKDQAEQGVAHAGALGAQRAAAFTLAVHAAIPHLLAGGRRTLAAAGLDDPQRFARELLEALYGHDPMDAA